MRRLIPVVLAAVGGAAPLAQQPPDAAVAQMLASRVFKNAVADVDSHHDRLVSDIVSLTEIASPPFKESARGDAYLALLNATGLTHVERDAVGNVMGLRAGTGGGPLIAIAAHLDTVFPEGTDVHVKRAGTRLSGPGIGDDTRSLAVLLAIVRAMDVVHVETRSDILFVGDVGEEGSGDLRGMKELFLKGPYRDRIKMFISMDDSGPGDRVTVGAVGSKRYRVTFKGPGGHSYGAFGLVNPAFAMADAMRRLSEVTVPATPKTTYNVGVVGGGTSVNAIPTDVWMDIDLRSESPEALAALDRQFHALVAAAVSAENRVRSTVDGPITADFALTGDRPSGETSRDSPLVRTASAAIRAMGMTPVLGFASTDSNIPISLGIPAMTIASGGTGDRAHALDEWIDVEKTASMKGIETAMLTLFTLAGAH